jgi:Flp pilus assembly protein TadD
MSGGGGIVVLLSLIVSLAGCVTKSKADAQARMAYLEGQRAALMQMQQQQQTHGQSVTVLGPVQNPIVKWSEGLTLGRAIVNAVYTSPTDPRNIVIRRSDQQIQFDPKRLLRGEDLPLEAGDTIQLEP